MSIGRDVPRAVLLGDGRVLVVGNDPFYGNIDPQSGYQSVRSDSNSAEVWDPSSAIWRTAASLNKPRGGFVAVPLADGRVLVTGGLNQPAGESPCGRNVSGQQSYSSTFVYDPTSGGGSWVRVGLLGTARAEPAAAVLPDGRVLVAGGSYHSGAKLFGRQAAPPSVATAYRPGAWTAFGSARPELDDVAPPKVGVALATAELYDPASGTWSATGSLRYARFGAAAATLADGRVLVVGSLGGPYSVVSGVADQAGLSAEIYDPKTGRFSLTGSLPPVDLAALQGIVLPRQGEVLPSSFRPGVTDVGTLVPLADGGAVLVGNGGSWRYGDTGGGYQVTRSFRFDAGSGRWSEIGPVYAGGSNAADDTYRETPGVNRLHALAARLPDGRVLVAGGDGSYRTVIPSPTAEVYDPRTNAWSALPPMPQGRTGGAAVVLRDGSVLLVGGYDPQKSRAAGCDDPIGLASAIRFVPSP